MKNLIKISSLFVVFFLGLSFSTTAQSSASVFRQMQKEIGYSKSYMVNYSGNTVRRKSGTNNYSYTYHDIAFVRNNLANQKITAHLNSVQFSDRNSFNGNKDKTSVDFKIVGSRVDMIITSHTWGGKNTIRNVKVQKLPFGYIITGHYSDSRSSTHFTASIYKSPHTPLL